MGNDNTRWRTQSRRDPGKGVDSVPLATALFESGYDRLSGAHALSQFPLAEVDPAAHVINQLAQGQVMLDASTALL